MQVKCQVYLHSWVLLSASPQAYSLKGYLLSNTVVRCFAVDVSVPVCQLSLHDACFRSSCFSQVGVVQF